MVEKPDPIEKTTIQSDSEILKGNGKKKTEEFEITADKSDINESGKHENDQNITNENDKHENDQNEKNISSINCEIPKNIKLIKIEKDCSLNLSTGFLNIPRY
ncbi:MAG: hypothetical protein GY749_47910 [Desulfobacteraceae bacterium]|nr:hypothetical protein [Desulfobacteraceae bacterium]